MIPGIADYDVTFYRLQFRKLLYTKQARVSANNPVANYVLNLDVSLGGDEANDAVPPNVLIS